MSVNKVILLGHLGQDPELKYTPSGAAVCKFSLATNESWTDRNGQKQDRTEWHRVTVWGKMAELCNQYLSKGRQAYIEGSLQTNSWEAQDGSKRYSTEINARTVKFIGGGAQASRGGASPQMDQQHGGNDFGGGFGGPQQDKPQSGGGQGFNMPSDNDFTADDIPF